mgnify:CR=1 FL=1
MSKISIFLFLSVFTVSLNAQNIKSEDLTYSFVKLPSKPVMPKVENYLSTITSAYEAENNKLTAQFEADKARAEADYQREMADYPVKVKAADDKYAKEMEAWNEKSTASKILEKQENMTQLLKSEEGEKPKRKRIIKGSKTEEIVEDAKKEPIVSKIKKGDTDKKVIIKKQALTKLFQ